MQTNGNSSYIYFQAVTRAAAGVRRIINLLGGQFLIGGAILWIIYNI